MSTRYTTSLSVILLSKLVAYFRGFRASGQTDTIALPALAPPFARSQLVTCHQTSQKKTPANRPVQHKRRWTNQERSQLLGHAHKYVKQLDMKAWTDAVEGRTAKQAYQYWRGTMAPEVSKMFKENRS
ncbi:hypothetical protein IAR55_006195 [Kwoniella newhampshirensis]|uniref:Myb-like domain-containing protein n=1 Tax=Kwoniella newhampshirensis TaxID=1651941 RepID=A0AAW0YU48_9TREE